MFNYVGVIESKAGNDLSIQPNDAVKYKVLIPTINSKNAVVAYVLTQPGIQVVYNKGDMVLVGEMDTKSEYIILGIIQTNSTTVAGTIIANSIYKQDIQTKAKQEVEPLPTVIKDNLKYFDNLF